MVGCVSQISLSMATVIFCLFKRQRRIELLKLNVDSDGARGGSGVPGKADDLLKDSTLQDIV